MNNLRTGEINASLERTLSRSRLSKYLAATDGSLSNAIALYERNTRLSEAFYTPLQCLEICLRNTLHFRMSEEYGADWVTNGGPPLLEMSQMMVQEAVTELQKSAEWPSNDDIVAEAKFAFWVGLLGPRYDGTIWRKTLFEGFAIGGRKKRQVVHSRFNAIRRLRNRIAHHEPIFHRNPLQLHKEIIEAIGWMCSDTMAWAEYHSRLESVYNGE